MTNPPHSDPRRFGDLLRFNEAETGFSARLIEKDYYCSVVLGDLAPLFDAGLVFKGGTCLSKIHGGFYRMSEDLDFALSVDPLASRPRRREAVEPVKGHFECLADRLKCFGLIEAVRGHDFSRHYTATIGYRSAVTGDTETIKLEVSTRERVIDPPIDRAASAILIDPVNGARLLVGVPVKAMSFHELFAEKIRAAATRKTPAIRDFFDIDFAIQTLGLDPCQSEFLSRSREKLQIGGAPVNLSIEAMDDLRRQLRTELAPVLRQIDYDAFDLDRAFEAVRSIVILTQETR
jgi:predicted nucleotidyltransferase component of viral defense system